MSFQHQNLWAVILGGSSGIGLATAKKLAKEGLSICIVHRDMRSRMQEAEKTFDEIRSIANLKTFNVDGSNPDVVRRVCEELAEITEGGKVRVVIHAISKGNLKSIFKSSYRPPEADSDSDNLTKKFREIDQIIEQEHQDVGLLEDSDITITLQAMSTSLIYWCRALMEKSLFAENARVIALTSEGNKKIWNSYVAIAMAKSSLETLVKYLAMELAPYNITVNAIQAGVTDTPSLRMIPGSDVVKASTINRNPFKRLTTGEDVANFIYLLCLDEASWVNGTVIPVDGGEHLF